MKTIKVLSLITMFFAAFALHGVSVVTSNSWSSTIGFTPVADSAEVAYDAFSSADVFAQATVAGTPGTSVFKRGHWGAANANYWGDPSKTAQTFYLTPESIGAGARWRTLKSNANGNYSFGNWSAINSTGDELSISISQGVSFARQVGVQIQGVNSFSSFRQNADSGELSLAVVPEPSTYALIAGLVAFLYIAIKRRNA